MIQEIWKDIKGYEGQYQISNYGNCRSLDRVIEFIQTNQFDKVGKIVRQKLNGKVLSKRFLKTGYIRYQLNSKDFFAHRLVASNFIGIIKPKQEINHIDGNKSNNLFTNLEIVNRTDNQDHAYHNNLHTHFKPSIKVTVDGITYNSLGLAQKATGISKFKLKKHYM